MEERHEDDPGFCRTGFYICTRDWCCIYGDHGNSNSPWADMREWQAWLAKKAALSATECKSGG